MPDEPERGINWWRLLLGTQEAAVAEAQAQAETAAAAEQLAFESDAKWLFAVDAAQ